MSLCIKNDIVWFEVSEDNISLVEVLKCQNNLAQINSRSLLLKPPILVQTPAHIAPFCVIQQQKQFFRGLKCIFKAHNKGVLGITQNVPLCFCVSSQILAHNLLFV